MEIPNAGQQSKTEEELDEWFSMQDSMWLGGLLNHYTVNGVA